MTNPMTKTDWTAEEVWDEADRAGDHSGLAQQMLTYLAERIEAGESAVTDEVVQIAVRAFRKAFATDGVSGLKKITFDAMRTTLLAVWTYPPAQPSQEQPGWKVPDGECSDLPPGYRMASRDGNYWPLFGDWYATDLAFPTRELAALAAWKQAYGKLDSRMTSIRRLSASPTPPKEK